MSASKREMYFIYSSRWIDRIATSTCHREPGVSSLISASTARVHISSVMYEFAFIFKQIKFKIEYVRVRNYWLLWTLWIVSECAAMNTIVLWLEFNATLKYPFSQIWLVVQNVHQLKQKSPRHFQWNAHLQTMRKEPQNVYQKLVHRILRKNLAELIFELDIHFIENDELSSPQLIKTCENHCSNQNSVWLETFENGCET